MTDARSGDAEASTPRGRGETVRPPGSGLALAAVVVMGGFLASKVAGLVRSVVIGAQYGASREYEAFLAAIGLTDTVFQVLAGGAVGAAFIPVFLGHLARGEREQAWRLASALANLAVLGVGLVAIVLGIAAPLVMQLLVAGWSPEDQGRAANLARIMLAAPVIFSVSALATSVLNGLHRFALAAAAPVVYNLSLIFGAVVLRDWSVEGLAWCAVLGALLHFAVQVPGLVQTGFHYTPTLGRELAGTGQVVRLMGPRVIGLGISQFNQLVNVALASFLVPGSVAYLSYAWLILMAPLGVFAMGIATATFPTLAEQSAAARTMAQRRTFVAAVRSILYVTIPSAAGLIVLGRLIVALLLERGALGPADAAATAAALTWFAIGLPGHAVIEIVDRVFYAQRDTATPVRVAAVGAALNVGLGMLLMRTELAFAGLALANSVAALVEAAALITILQRRTRWDAGGELLTFVRKVATGATAAALLTAAAQAWLGTQLSAAHWGTQLLQLAALASLGGAAFLGTSAALGIHDARDAVNGVLRRRA